MTASYRAGRLPGRWSAGTSRTGAVVARAGRRLAGLAVAVVALLLLVAEPASAHGGPGGSEREPGDFVAVVSSFDAPAGVRLDAEDGGVRLVLTNDTSAPVVVRGYEGEPYLLVRRDGVFENVRSPAVGLNRQVDGSAPADASADPTAAPSWRRIGDGPTAVWHDHRAHWMLPFDPPEAVADPGTSHLVIPRWEIPIEVDGRLVDAVGSVRWDPPPTPWPWVLVVALLAAGVAWAGSTRRWSSSARVAVGLLVAVVACDWWSMVAGPVGGGPTVAGAVAPGLVVAGLVVGAALLRRHPMVGTTLLAGAGTTAALLVGWSARAYLSSAHVPTAAPAVVARSLVAAALGLGLGLAGAWAVTQRHTLVHLAPRGLRPVSSPAPRECRPVAPTRVDLAPSLPGGRPAH